MIRRPPRSTQSRSSAASDVYKRQVFVSSRSCVDTTADGVARRVNLDLNWDGPDFLIHLRTSPSRPSDFRAGLKAPCWTPVELSLYTSDAADDLLCLDLGGRRIIKK